jgi:hypothetical protein
MRATDDASTVSVNVNRPFSRCPADRGERLPQLYRYAGCTFLDVYPPEIVKSIGQVDPNSGELIVFLLLDSEAKPVPRYKKAAVAVYVKALVRHPSVRASGLAVFLRGELGMMGEDVSIHHHCLPVDRQDFRFRMLSRRV